MMTSKPKQILLMDDSILAMDVARDALEQEGYAVVCALDLDQFETQMATSKPDLVLMDVQMPEAFGDDIGMVVRTVRGIDVPIFLYSMLDEAELAERARAAEIDGYICKRNGVTVLVERVRTILGGAS
jgi:DNA-binding NarL/FixJ family response regulator